MSTRLTRRVVPKAADYTIKFPMDAPGTVFTNRGAEAAVTFTLPTPGRQLLGVWYQFKAVADQSVTVAGAANGDVLALDDDAANSVAASTASEKIGALLEAVCVESAEGTFKWAVSGLSVGHTFTVTT